MPKLSEVTAPQKRKLSEVTGGNANNSDFASMVSGKPKAAKTVTGQSRAEALAYGGGPAVAAEDFLRAAGHHVGNLAQGTGQLIHKGVTAVTDAVLPEGNSFRQAVDGIDRRGGPMLAKREAAYQARVPDSGAAYAGAAVGEVLPWMTGLGELRAAGILPKIAEAGPGLLAKAANIAKKGGLLALEGGAMGALQPVAGDGPYAAQKGAQIGVGAIAAPVMASGLAGLAAGGRAAVGASRYLTPSGQDAIANARLSRMLGGDAGTVDQLRAPSGVPGFQPTPAQALATPEAIQAERVLRNNGLTAPAFAARESANNGALRDHVARVAGTDADMQAAAQARRDGPGAFWRDNLPRGAENGRYGRAAAHIADFQGSRTMPRSEFDLLDQARKIAGQVQRGTIGQAEGDAAIRALQPKLRASQKALDQALGVIDNGMVNPSRIVSHLQELSKDTNKTIAGAANDAIAGLAKNQDGQGWVHARVLDGLRQNLGTLLQHNSAPNAAVGTREGAALGPLKAKITNAIDRAVPGYRGNLAAYASHSQPINDMEAGRALLSAIDSGGRDAGGNQAVNLNAVKALIAKDNHANFPMSPGARAQIESVLQALQQRSVTNNTVSATGPGTASDLQRALTASPLLMRILGHGGAAIGGAFGGLPGYAAGVGVVEGANALNNNVVRKLGQKAASASSAADAIEAHRLRLARPRSALGDLLLPYDRPPPMLTRQ